jgi:branched-chain amino acid transport system substrate-binding protein
MSSGSTRLTMSRARVLAALGGIAAAGAVPSFAQAQAQPAGKIYTFGALFPMTGPGAEIGQDQLHGMELAVDDVNARGGVAGWKLKGIVVDHKGTAAGGVQAMNQLVNLEKVPFVITGFAGVTLAAQPIAAQNQVVMMNIGGTSINLLDKPWLYNDQVIGESLNQPLAQYAWDHGIRTVAVLVSEDPLGKDNAALFVADFQKLGGRIVANETFPVNNSDFSPQLTKIRAANPQGLYNIAVGDTSGLLVKQARANDFKGLFFGPLAVPNLFQVGGKAAEGFVTTSMAVDFTSKSREVQRFLATFKAKYGNEPTWVSGTPYEAVLYLTTLINEVARSGGDPRNGGALLKALESRPAFPNVLSGGQVVLQKDHGSIRAVALSEVRDGKFVQTRVVTPK